MLGVAPDTVALPSSQAPRRGENKVAAEKARLNGHKRLVLEYLQSHGSATNVELSQPHIGGLAASRRVWDLTQDGYDIRKTHVKDGVWRWTLYGIQSL